MIRLVVAAVGGGSTPGLLERISRALLESGHEVVLLAGSATAQACAGAVEQEDAGALVVTATDREGAVACAAVLDLWQATDTQGTLVVLGPAAGDATTLEQRGARVFGADAPSIAEMTQWVRTDPADG